MPSLTPLSLGPRGESIIKSIETLRLTAYRPTPSDRWTIGWGSTRNVKQGMTIDIAEAQRRFASDTSDAIREVNKLLYSGVILSQSMFDALVSLVFNVGGGAIDSDSTIGLALRSKPTDYYAAWAGFVLWRKQRNRSTGELQNLLGLARRRAQEMVLFLEDDIPKNA